MLFGLLTARGKIFGKWDFYITQSYLSSVSLIIVSTLRVYNINNEWMCGDKKSM